ncbi:hypothetical protein L218DRAFT_1003646 [Marasmius fiardii PR-910]|nr:hypothetical protein L218DRAFT_1003646 [Marasmius fiardii PR-910]
MTQSQQSQPSVLIVGAGPTGLALALTLLTNSVPVRIISKERTFSIGSRGPAIQPRTQELLKLLNIWDDMEKHAGHGYELTFHSSPQGPKPLTTSVMTETVEEKPEYFSTNPRMLDQDAQEGIYRAHLKNRFNVEIELGTEFKSLEQYPDHVITHLVKHTAEGSEIAEEAKFSWVVGADGGKSPVRKQLGISFLGETENQGLWVLGDVTVKGGYEGIERKNWNIWGSPQSRMAMMHPITSRSDGFTFMIAGKDVDTAKVSSSTEEFTKAFHDISGRSDIEFGELIWIGVWRLNVRMVQKFREGRVFLAGDAAHTHSPTGGQGMNTSVQDAINLGWKLALVQKGLAPISLLDSYNSERQPVIASMLGKTTDLYKQSFKSSVTKEIQNGWFRDFETRMFGVNYRGSPVVIDERYSDEDGKQADPYRAGHDAVHGGDRAPEAPGLVSVDDEGNTTTTSLYEIFKPSQHTVLIFDDHADDVQPVIEWLGRSQSLRSLVQTVVIHPSTSLPSGTSATAAKTGSKSGIMVLEDREGYAYKHYGIGYEEEGAKRVRIVVVRPDAYVGALVKGVEGMEEYFKRVLVFC